MNTNYKIRKAKPEEFKHIGSLLIKVYSQLDGFPKQEDQPNYYSMLSNIGELTTNPHIELLVAINAKGKIGGAVLYFNNMQYYGSGGSATQETNASGFRLLAVDPEVQGMGLGKQLSLECIRKAKKLKQAQVIIHSTKAMQVAWKMYEKLGFKRSLDLDFMQEELPVFGFRLHL